MPSVLIQFAHPTFQTSRANKAMVQAIQGLEGITFRDLYEIYPDFHIDLDTEKELLQNHEVLVLQHPFQWYSCPSLLKEWLDVVLAYGWAYGPNGEALKHKKLLSAITAGGTKDTYTREGNNRYTIPEFLSAFDQTARLCQMVYVEPFVFHESIRATPDLIEKNAQDYRNRILSLRDDKPEEAFHPFFDRAP